ncbi:uncharacterized protein LOC113360186 [Papaver somniferum]|uniref:uncharacterized protein LOC113360186 n=1 Tax=Papaver somniferum TaxID=3469 RepID=UPI000E6F9EFA|nr:uncharacterized protein LOC113360186 [Papaver somniferum]
MGQNYTENLKIVYDGITNMSKNIDNLITALAKQQLQEDERSKTKVVEKRQQREEERVVRGGNGPPPPPPPPAARANTIDLKFPTFDGEDPDGWIFNADQYFSVTIVTWLEFCVHVRARFAPEKFVDARLAISTINQVDDYLINFFIRSLKPHIGSVVKLLAPKTLNEAFTKEIHQEEAYATVNKLPTRQLYRPPPLRDEASTSTTPIKKLTLPTGYNKLSREEMKEKREKGLCFNCDAPFKSGHICPDKPGFLLLEMDPHSPEGITEIEYTTENHQASDDLAVLESTPTISLNSLLGSTFPNTMSITGYAKARPLTILIDSGSTHNFLHPSISKKCGFAFSSTDHVLRVTVGNGGHLNTKVLGIQWLRTLGEIVWDFEKLTMQFSIQDTAVRLTGNQSSAVMIMDVSPMQRLLSTENYGILLELVALNTSAAKHLELLPEIKQLLSTFGDIFSTPTTLPPERIQDHKISLLPETGPVNKGGSWCMCVDYRALNKITIKDRYPIPVVDELLDELHGNQVFTKLDLRYGYHQIRVHDADIPKTAFRTHDGHNEFSVVPFRLSNAPATFHSLMNYIFRPYLRKFVLVFFDDILIYSENFDDHIKHLELVFEILRNHKLFVKESKCTFAQKSVGYLGHLISSDGVSVEC